MSHALIIEDNMVVSFAIKARLGPLGYSSFDLAWTEENAVVAAGQHAPDLVVVGDNVEAGSAIRAARRISDTLSVPVLLVTSDPYRVRFGREQPCSFDGPFLLDQMAEALQLARRKARAS
ncbi:MAG TPA: hypothetical protein VHQ39_00885 [Dongiaceae bacterium]|nr:hypothetical protein [Dongiaceae bacterium]